MADTFKARWMPGQETGDETAEEYQARIARLIRDACEGDPGEGNEPREE